MASVILFLFLFSIFVVFVLCFVISAIQFFIDLHKCSDLRQDMQDTIKRIKKQSLVEESEVTNND